MPTIFTDLFLVCGHAKVWLIVWSWFDETSQCAPATTLAKKIEIATNISVCTCHYPGQKIEIATNISVCTCHYPGQKNWDSHASQTTQESTRPYPSARSCLNFFGQDSIINFFFFFLQIFGWCPPPPPPEPPRDVSASGSVHLLLVKFRNWAVMEHSIELNFWCRRTLTWVLGV